MNKSKYLIAIIICGVLCIGCCCFYAYTHAQIKDLKNGLISEAQVDAENVQKDNDYLSALLEKHEKSEKKKTKKSKEDK